MIRSIIVDDEAAVHSVLINLLGRHCPNVNICGSAYSAEEGAALVKEQSPQLVFLDIKMPALSGFEMLDLIDNVGFDVIFISGFNDYAVKAFEINAVDYVLKPIDYTRLVAAVERAHDRIQNRKNLKNSHIIHFIRSLEEQSKIIQKLSIHRQDKVHFVDLNDVACIKSVKGCTEIVMVSGKIYISSKPLGEYEEMLSLLDHFLRVNRNILINMNHIIHYTKGSNCFITLRGTEEDIEVSRRRKTVILAAINSLHK